jgi:predicted nuclease of predicted toxin-antitoxin system
LLFLIDTQLPPALAEALRRDGFDALHTADLGMLAETDTNIWNEVVRRSAVLVTKDRDFAMIRAARQRGPTILWIRFGNMDNRNLITRISRALPRVVTSV